MNLDNLHYRIKYSARRKKLSFKALDATHLEVLAPVSMSKQHIETAIVQNISAVKRILKNVNDRYININYRDGVTVPYRGREITLLYRDLQGLRWQYLADEATLVIEQKYRTKSDSVLKDFYGKQVHVIAYRCRELATSLELPLNRISLRWTVSRWGSCSSLKNINLSSYLIMASPELQDYVIYHELCHLKHANHSPAFYKQLEAYDPDFHKHRQWLKDNGWKLRIFPHSEAEQDQ
jgi:predicted metal-dependent hydrolase